MKFVPDVPRRAAALGLVFCLSLLLLAGCVEKIPLQPHDVTGHLWLGTLPGRQIDGFYVGGDGHLLLIGDNAVAEGSWSLEDNLLVLGIQGVEGGEPERWALQPRKDGAKLRLVPTTAETDPGFVRAVPHEPLARRQYHPVYLAGMQKSAEPQGEEPVYLQFDVQEGAVLGFAGVNNFFGRYQRRGAIGFHYETQAATVLASPGMEYEMVLLDALEQADTLLAFGDRLLLYRGATLLLSLRAR